MWVGGGGGGPARGGGGGGPPPPGGRPGGGGGAGGRPRAPRPAGRWLLWQEGGTVEALSTEGGQGWSRQAEAAELPEVLDDWLLLPLRSGGLRAIHLPTGLSLDLETGPGLLELRGAGGGGFTTWLRTAGEPGYLAEWTAPVRVFEEDGAAGSGDPLEALPGGHGGSHGLLLSGASRVLELDPGAGGWLLERWVHAGGDDPPEVALGGRALPVAPLDGSVVEPGAWVRLADVSVPASATWEQRRLRITWTAADERAIVDAVRLRRREGR